MARETPPTPARAEPLLKRLLRRRADEPSADRGTVESPAPTADTTGTVPMDGSAASADEASSQSPQASPPGPASPPPSRVDPVSGRPIDDLVDADLPPLDSIGPDSDVRAFLGRNVSPELRRQALRKLFHQPKFNVICLCAEYAENYNNFTPMGSIVPHDLKRQLALQAERLAKRLLEQETTAAAVADPAGDGPGTGAADMLQRDSGEASTKVLTDAGDGPDDASRNAADEPQRG